MKGVGEISPFHWFTNPQCYKSVCFWSWGTYLLYKTPGQEKTTLGDNFFGGSRKVWSLVTCFKKQHCPLILCSFCHDFIHVHSPWAGADNPLGPKFWCQQEDLIFLVICFKFKKKSLQYLLLYIAAVQGQTSLSRQNFDVNRKLWSLRHLLQVLKKQRPMGHNANLSEQL